MGKKSTKRIEKEQATIKSFENKFKMLDDLHISYDRTFCKAQHGYVVHAWLDEAKKVNLFMKTLRFVPFGFHKGISGQGFDELVFFLKHYDDYIQPEKKEYSYKEKYEALKQVLLQVRNERNFDVIDSVLDEYR